MDESDARMNASSETTRTGGSLLVTGPAAGIAGGLGMAACLVFSAAVQGTEPLAAIEPMGATFAAAESFEGGDRAVLFGLVLHLGVSALVGLLFAAVLPRGFPSKEAGVMCIGFAFAVMGFMTSAIVPAVNPVLKARFHDLGGSWVVAHAVFGFTTGYACQRLRRGLEARAGRHAQRASA